MILGNWYKIMASLLYGNVSTGTAKLTNCNGDTEDVYRHSPTNGSYGYRLANTLGFYGLHCALSTSYTPCRVVFGTGNVAPTLDDYKLSGDIVTGLASSVNTTTVNNDDGSTTTTAVYTVTNNTTDDITIREVGCCGYSSGNTSWAGNGVVLIERTVLDEPVTIPAGGVGQVTYTIRMNYPTA